MKRGKFVGILREIMREDIVWVADSLDDILDNNGFILL